MAMQIKLIVVVVVAYTEMFGVFYTAVSRKVVLKTEKSLHDNVESYYG